MGTVIRGDVVDATDVMVPEGAEKAPAAKDDDAKDEPKEEEAKKD